MKKFFYCLFCLLILSCVYSIQKQDNIKENDNSIRKQDINKIITNGCIDTNGYEIFQVSYDGALAYECKNSSYCLGKVVFLPNNGIIEYYDGMKINISSDKCAVIDRTYTYETQAGNYKTVPIVKIYHKYYSNVLEYLQERYDYETHFFWNRCLDLATKQFPKNNIETNGKKCKCTIENIFHKSMDETMNEIGNQKYNNIDDIVSGINELFLLKLSKKSKTEQIKKLCGKIPQGLFE